MLPKTRTGSCVPSSIQALQSHLFRLMAPTGHPLRWDMGTRVPLGWHPPKGAETAVRGWGRLSKTEAAGGDTEGPIPGARQAPRHCHGTASSAGSRGHRRRHATAHGTRWHLAFNKRAMGAARCRALPNSLGYLHTSGERRAGLRTAQLSAGMAAALRPSRAGSHRAAPARGSGDGQRS